MLEIQVKVEGLEIYESEEFEGELAFTYAGEEYLLGDFMYTAEHEGWHGVMGLSYYSAFYICLEEGYTVTLGYAYW